MPGKTATLGKATSPASAALPTRERLLAAAAEAFDRDGYAGASVIKIATRALATNGSLYHFAKGKPQLAGMVLDGAVRRYHAMLLPVIAAPAASLPDLVQAMIMAHHHWALTHLRDVRLLDILGVIGDAARRAAQRSALTEPVQQALAQAFAPWEADGAVPPLAPAMLYAIILGPVIALVAAQASQATIAPVDDAEGLDPGLLARLVEMAVTGLCPRPEVDPGENNERHRQSGNQSAKAVHGDPRQGAFF